MSVLKALKGVSYIRAKGTIVQCSITDQQIIISRTKTLQTVNVTDVNVCGAEFDIESGGRTSAITETDHDSAIVYKTDHDSVIVYENEHDTTSNVNESNVNTLSDVDKFTFIETPIISSKISSDKPEDPETAPPASTCCPP